MLNFTLKRGEEIIISDCISVKFAAAQTLGADNWATLTTNAPKQVQVDRERVYHDKNITNPDRPLAWIEDLAGKFALYSGENLDLDFKRGHKMRIGADAILKVVSVGLRKIQLSFDVPRGMPVNRKKNFEDKVRDGTLFKKPGPSALEQSGIPAITAQPL